MELYIKVQNGQIIDHPMLAENVLQAFPEVDVNSLPNWLAKFEKSQRPIIGVYEILENISYEFDNGVVKDVYNIRPMTLEEKTAKQNAMKASFPNYEENGFVFNEELCEIEPILKLGVTRV